MVEPENPEALAEAIVDVVGSASTVWPARTQRTRDVVLGEYDETVQKHVSWRFTRSHERRIRIRRDSQNKDLTNSLIRATIQRVTVLFMLNSNSNRPIHAADAASRVYGTDAVVISPEEGKVRLLNLTATRNWQLADGSRSVDEIATTLTEEYESTSNRHINRSPATRRAIGKETDCLGRCLISELSRTAVICQKASWVNYTPL